MAERFGTEREFFLWKASKRIVATYDNMQRMRFHVVSRCYFYEKKEAETMSHLFLTAPTAQKLWKQFVNFKGIQVEGRHLQQLIYAWWITKDQLSRKK